jgi:hypothetical protein
MKSFSSRIRGYSSIYSSYSRGEGFDSKSQFIKLQRFIITIQKSFWGHFFLKGHCFQVCHSDLMPTLAILSPQSGFWHFILLVLLPSNHLGNLLKYLEEYCKRTQGYTQTKNLLAFPFKWVFIYCWPIFFRSRHLSNLFFRLCFWDRINLGTLQCFSNFFVPKWS